MHILTKKGYLLELFKKLLSMLSVWLKQVCWKTYIHLYRTVLFILLLWQ